MADGRGNEDADRGTGIGSNGIATDGRKRRLLAYAELVRLPNLVTAPPDVILGAALVAAAGGRPSIASIGGLAVVSVLLYAGGTTLNDAFDAPVDARERPDRPVPSGRVPRRTAFGLGFGLLLVAVVAAFGGVGRPGGVVAGLLAVAIVAYDGLLKGTAAGFLAMGATRGLNVVLGTTAVGDSAVAVLESQPVALAVPALVVGYVAAVTFMADRETAGGTRTAVAVAAAGAATAVLGFGWYLAVVGPSGFETAVAVGFAGAFCWWIGRPLRDAYADPTPDTIGPAVGACVLGLVLLDAAFAAAAGVGWGIAAGVFLGPAVALSRVADVT
ncbi:UbiA family prenyltransferase [Halopiger djelfimassiliensis]|uniref:UbiA family prenyltransferase n=1 Tax=Halopiger djelfimassiliensis TaxID=1293047 RepID=UPI000A50479B|nr:UbiA family prenyltransferase [Halopiger djelfimassiliensis]